MQKRRITMIIIALILLMIGLFITNFDNLSWSNNKGNYLGIIAILFAIVTMIISYIIEVKRRIR